MAERWQQWMPHDIDAWQGSANVQALSDLAYRAVHNLLQDMWKQCDCSLPLEDRELSKRSRVMQRWQECKEEVLEYFSDRTESGRLTHRVLLRKFKEAQEVYEKRQAAAKKTNSVRSASGDRDGDRSQSVTLEPRNADTQTQTRTIQEQYSTEVQEQAKTLAPSANAPVAGKVKKARDVKPVDERHTPFREAFFEHNKRQTDGMEPAWGSRQAGKLAEYLASKPRITLEHWNRILEHKARSDVARGAPLTEWIDKYAEKLYVGPLNEFGNHKASAATVNPGRYGWMEGKNGESKGKSGQTVDVARDFLAQEADRLGLNRDGSPKASPQTIDGRYGSLHGGPPALSDGFD